MGRRGPPPKPSAQRALEGGTATSHRPPNEHEPKPPPLEDVPDPPRRAEFGPVARRVWRAKAAEAQRIGVLTGIDLEEFAQYCVLHQELADLRAMKRRWMRDKDKRDDVWRIHTRIDSKAGQLRQYSDRFGFNPAARTGLQVVQPKGPSDESERDPHDELAARRAARRAAAAAGRATP